jgi:hypothetical protein
MQTALDFVSITTPHACGARVPTVALDTHRLSFKNVGELRPHFPDRPGRPDGLRTARGPSWRPMPADGRRLS